MQALSQLSYGPVYQRIENANQYNINTDSLFVQTNFQACQYLFYDDISGLIPKTSVRFKFLAMNYRLNMNHWNKRNTEFFIRMKVDNRKQI
ncbi:MAG TPA: hypothetical protein DIU00_04095 [Phycisphaerales bacterium]|nr:hypothetical protein [Phycisphaerales bacterium]